MKRLILFSIIIISLSIFSQEATDIFKQVLLLENEAFSIAPEYGNMLKGQGLVSDIDFDIMREKYKGILSEGEKNPFIYLAYGFTFHYKKDFDSANFYFEKASNISNLDYLLHLRLYQIYSTNVVKRMMDYELGQLDKLKYMIGATSLPEIAAYLNFIAIESYRNKKTDDALTYLLLATRLDPFNIQIVNNILNLSIKEKRFEYVGFAMSKFKNYFKDDMAKIILIYNILKFIRYFILILFLFIVITLMIKNLDKYLYFFNRYIRIKLLPKQKIFLALLILFLPLILQMNLILWFFYATIITFSFFEKKEKIFLIIVLLPTFFIPFIYKIESHIIGVLNPDDNINVILKAENSYWNAKLFNRLNTLLEEEPFNTALLFSKAKLYKKGGFFENAEEEYSKILLKGESFAELYNNLGNLMFLKGFYNKAIDYYNKSVELSPNLAEPYYNLGQVYLKLLNLQKSNEYIEIANKLNYELISSFLENTDENFYNTVVIDCPLPEKYIWEEFAKRKKIENTPVMMGLRIGIYNPLSFFTMILSIILSFLSSHKIRISRCYTCNKPISEGDRIKYNEKYICKDDYTVINDTISDLMKVRKFESFVRIKKKKNFILRKMLSVIFPGLGKIYEGSYFTGIILLVFSLSLLILILLKNLFLMRNPNFEIGIQLFDVRFLFLGILILFYFISFITTRKEE